MKPGRSAAEGEEALDDVLDRLVREGPTDRELEKARNLLEAELVKSLKTNHGAGEQLGFFEAIYGSHRAMFSAADPPRKTSSEPSTQGGPTARFGSSETVTSVVRLVSARRSVSPGGGS